MMIFSLEPLNSKLEDDDYLQVCIYIVLICEMLQNEVKSLSVQTDCLYAVNINITNFPA